MDDEAAVAEEGGVALERRRELVQVGRLEGVRRDGAVLAAQVADLARLLQGLVAGHRVAADEWVEVGRGVGAVAVAGDGLVVQVVGWWFRLVESADDGKVYAHAAVAG